MAKIFLDTNYYIDIVYRKPEVLKKLEGSLLYYSPLSTHILFYALKIKIPSKEISKIMANFNSINLTEEVLQNALNGPTEDLEDNIQLHSSAMAECDVFLTNDKNLLKMKFFGKVKILNSLDKTN